MPEDLAAISNAQRLRILNALDTIRDNGHAIAGAALKGSRAVRMGAPDDAEQLAEIIAKCAENHRLAQSIARELSS